MKLATFGFGLGLALAGLSGVMSANGAMLVDRGLPTANLNNAAGASRANVAWTEGGYSPTDYWLDGDTFKNTSSQTWSIDTIRLWTINITPTATAALWGGIDGSTIGIVSGSGAISAPMFYSDGITTYQGSSGALRDMHQIDFAVGITLSPGQTYDFFLDGTGNNQAGLVVPYAHASNAALSGSPQDGADDSMLYANIVSGSFVPGSVGSWTSLNNGWDKASDLNVQVLGTVVPEPTTTTLMVGALLLPFGARALRLLRKTRTA